MANNQGGVFLMSEGIDMTYPLLSTVRPAPPTPLRFITTTRARSSSHGSAGAGDSRAGGDTTAALPEGQGPDWRGYEEGVRSASVEAPRHELVLDSRPPMLLWSPVLIPSKLFVHVTSPRSDRLEHEPFGLAFPCLPSARTAIHLPLVRSRPCLRLPSLYRIETPARILDFSTDSASRHLALSLRSHPL
ncbi:hypothetical protein DFH08DRAFT_958708 [Mycena albidolilacea]|uniref:Uncharacterized protein n=1 Tax=Mycena albidolilacea TaxID=1033008 RepID=A0AAD7A611_9AGAR|nr:hypothetical protein DFH08DRAFT_958708 [Mycena albidolilacea]